MDIRKNHEKLIVRGGGCQPQQRSEEAEATFLLIILVNSAILFLVTMGKEKMPIAIHLTNYANVNHKNKIHFWGEGYAIAKRITILHGGWVYLDPKKSLRNLCKIPYLCISYQ